MEVCPSLCVLPVIREISVRQLPALGTPVLTLDHNRVVAVWPVTPVPPIEMERMLAE